MTIAADSAIHWTPAADQVGEHVVELSVSDGRCSDGQPYRLAVLPDGVDLTVDSVDTSGVTTDPAALLASGRVQVPDPQCRRQ